MLCYLCLETTIKDNIGIYTDAGERLEISQILAKHFWLKPTKLENAADVLCLPCWDALQCFHSFYQRVAAAHSYLETKLGASTILIDEDPLPNDNEHKSELNNVNNNELLDENGIGFFDPEVKVEVRDLDLLPTVEIIEEANNSTTNQRAVRASRRQRNAPTTESPTESKRVKSENLPVAVVVKFESEPEIAIHEIISVELKTDELAAVQTEASSEVQKKKRGRPRKIKEEDNATEDSLCTSKKILRTSTNKIKDEAEAEAVNKQANNTNDNSDCDAAGWHDATEADPAAGTDDSTLSTSNDSDDNDAGAASDDSWHQPRQKYAEIPKRVIVKPKKYRKRPKPKVPPKRLTREEIEKKNALQAEYDQIIGKFFDTFACPRCNLLVQNFGEMKAHFRVSHNDDGGYMTCCGRKFHLRKRLADHVLVHWNPEHFKCGTCAKVFQDERSLEVHEQSHVNPNEAKEKKIFQCEKCPKTFTTKAAFEYHSFSKHVPKSEFQFACPECNKKLPTKRKLKDHMKYAHDPESAVMCDKCGKQMRNQSSLKKHHEIEHSDKPRPVPVPMQCEICGTWLRHASGLKQHMKTIHEEAGGEHRCHICNKTSTNARALKRHIYHNHECERKFKCTMCEKAFKRPQDLREHTSTHTGEVLYTCPNCPMTFFSNANMYKHRQRLHRAEWENDRKKPRPPNIMGQAVSATAAMKMKQSVGAANAFFATKTNSPTMDSTTPVKLEAQAELSPTTVK